jgi:hypothetical protein
LALEQVAPYPDNPSSATFAASGSNVLVVTDNSGADMDIAVGVIAVQVNAPAATLGGTQGVNELVRVTAMDATGDVRTVHILLVDTIVAWGPTGQVSTASQEQPTYVSYRCDVLGRATLGGSTSAGLMEAVLDADGSQGLDDMYDGLYGPYINPLAAGWGSNTLLGDADIADVWCGGNTGGLFDNSVTFQTDKGILDITPGAWALQQDAASLAVALGWFFPPSLDAECGSGKNINVADNDALTGWWAFFNYPLADFEAGCDVDGWQNGVVTTQLLGTGEVGVATIKAQQGGGISPPRTINVTFVGEAALSLFIEAPALVGLTGAEFTALVVDQDGRPVGDETVECTVEPAGGALAIVPQTGTTNSTTGEVSFDLIPTGASVLGGEELTITCVLDRDRSVRATETITLSTTPLLESVALVEGCNPIASTWGDGTAIEDVAGAVTPADALGAIWKFDPATGRWLGYSPTAPPAVSDLDSVDFLDAVFICVDAAATVKRPVI